MVPQIMPHNPLKSQHRPTQANAKRTEERIEQYYGLVALHATWEDAPDDVQVANHDYIIRLRTRIRNVKNYILNRADARFDFTD